MTDEEVKKIYDYLHENYRYEDGNLIRKKPIHGSKVGRVMGSFRLHPEGYGYAIGAFSIKGKDYNKRMSHLIYLYHHEVFPKYIKYLDRNITNVKIENLENSQSRHHKDIKITKSSSSKMYRPGFILNGKYLSLGTYTLEENAAKAIKIAKEMASNLSLTSEEIRNKTRELMGKPPIIKKKRTLPLGVTLDKKRYRACIRINGVKNNLGSFKCPQEAHQAYLKAKNEKA